MADPILSEVLRRFRDPKARPKVIRVYSPEHGWSASPLREVLTEALASQLKLRGYTSVEIKWHRISKQMSLL